MTDAETLAIKLLVQHEGLRLKPYRDTAGKLTIGVGRNLDDVGISKQEAAILLQNDLRRAVTAARLVVGEEFERLDPARQAVIIDMAFNLGQKRLSDFRKMINAVRRKDYALAAQEMRNSLWAKQVKGRAERLSNIMETGVLSFDET